MVYGNGFGATDMLAIAFEEIKATGSIDCAKAGDGRTSRTTVTSAMHARAPVQSTTTENRVVAID